MFDQPSVPDRFQPQRPHEEMSAKAWVLMPLYIYPLTDKTWKPLYDAITAHPDLHFLVIVNPNSGPGEADLPGRDYVREVPRLNSFPNVRTVGYVRIDYCRRPLSHSCQEIERYAAWDRDHEISGLYVQGIYLDETPNHVSDHATEYLEALLHFIKRSEGLLGDRSTNFLSSLLETMEQVIHNPGTPPEGELTLFGNPDMVCVCEEPYERYQNGDGVQKRLQDYAVDWDRNIYQISGIPAGDVQDAVRELCRRGRYIFATTLISDFYESFGPCWMDFVAAVRKSHD